MGDFFWIRTPEDGVWWPAVRVDTPQEFLSIPLDDSDIFIRIFFPGRSAEQCVFPVCSTDAAIVRRLNWSRAGPDAQLFRDPRVDAAVTQADEYQKELAAASRSSSEQRRRLPPAPATVDSSLPFSREMQQKIQRLVGSLDPAAAAQIRPALLAPPAPPARQVRAPRESLSRRSSNDVAPQLPEPTVAAPSTTASQQLQRREVSTSAPQSQISTSQRSRSIAPATEEVEEEIEPSTDRAEFDEAALEVLRMETFDSREKFILDPTLRFVNLLGAVAVRSASLRAELPNRKFIYDGEHRAIDRVLLIPFDPITYHHEVGWMEKVTLERDMILQLRIFINGHEVSVPQNWSIAASKTGTAVRSAIPLDITDVIECTLPDEEAFEIRIEFENQALVPDMMLWEASLACVLAEVVDLETVKATIRDNCRAHVGTSSKSRRGRPHQRQAHTSGVETQEVSTKCPLTSVTLQVPCRGHRCEHPQCMELFAILQQCNRRHVWNCPLCNEPMPPDSILVDYALMELLKPKRGHPIDDTVLWCEATGTYSQRAKRTRSQGSAELVID
ncbi:zinc finger protein, putative [Bodo saltans]|uniref:Zinc finger protein, putative n=1 Tax=Bodo saltans TaxID=75058 RepID=A0A0S4JLR1_BODSA|nr:zinc finger protein, putative [Bodo saltans]|eukprot:CUG91057.1 zinc finger protein, putative [Bodo saltans]